jgi:hypothetical protein
MHVRGTVPTGVPWLDPGSSSYGTPVPFATTVGDVDCIGADIRSDAPRLSRVPLRLAHGRSLQHLGPPSNSTTPSLDSDGLQTLLTKIRTGDREARNRLFELVYDDLRRRAHFERGRPGARSLNTTAVVHEAYLKLAGASRLEPEYRAHFMRIADRAMRQVIVDRARKQLAEKRGGAVESLRLGEVEVGAEDPVARLVALDEALCV